MAKILFVSDVHIGIRYSYRVDLRTGISERTLDFVKALARVVDYAIKEQIDVFVICGDLFDRVTIGPTLLRIVRERIWQPLIAAEIPIILIGGNHDSPQIIEKGSPFGEVSLIPNSIAVRTPQKHEFTVHSTGERIGFVLLPYMTATQAVTYVETIMGEQIDREVQMIRSQELFKETIKKYVTSLDTETKIIVGHFYVHGSKIGVIPYPDRIHHEFVMKKDMLPLDEIDLAVFGHIHTTQTLYEGKVLVPGSLERVDFGEINEEKGFYAYETESKNLKFISSSPRKMIKKYIEVQEETQNPTEFILEQIPLNIENTILRIKIKIPSHLKEQVLLRRILPFLEQKTYHFELVWDTSEEVTEFVLPDLELNPLALFSDFVSERYGNYPHQKELRERGLEILDVILSKVEDEK
ncbi:MAG: exonuclease subunit SbcD [Candidatus Heimdallarchaeota archaeon]|nr:MAG: exonuclease subunit SbcD [Candidatus Heimdallarchaeota archaeon]